MIDISGMNFDKEVLEEGNLVVADFWASWCNPCKMLGVVLEEVSEEIGSKVKFVKINVEENPQLAQRFNVKNLPTLMVFNKGELKDMVTGFKPKQDIEKFIQKNL
ncbi:thioredoxin [Hathewaya massiliensis]|uniref:thioredoxin n=1 Tax=Hathewaya massiliensis TaxID=1964382 RepID=UPI00115A327F|nr:thioredoxin [Hathewaya massiliensis]